MKRIKIQFVPIILICFQKNIITRNKLLVKVINLVINLKQDVIFRVEEISQRGKNEKYNLFDEKIWQSLLWFKGKGNSEM